MANPGLTAARIAAITSMVKRSRFAKDPPYASVRLLLSGERNCWNIYPWPPCTSMPSRPPAWQRLAAAAKPAISSCIWSMLISIGTSPSIGEGIGEHDQGVHRVAAPESRRGSRLTGDVHAESVARVAAALTPVPGGVGPMTVAMVVANTVLAAQRLAQRGARV